MGRSKKWISSNYDWTCCWMYPIHFVIWGHVQLHRIEIAWIANCNLPAFLPLFFYSALESWILSKHEQKNKTSTMFLLMELIRFCRCFECWMYASRIQTFTISGESHTNTYTNRRHTHFKLLLNEIMFNVIYMFIHWICAISK